MCGSVSLDTNVHFYSLQLRDTAIKQTHDEILFVRRRIEDTPARLNQSGTLVLDAGCANRPRLPWTDPRLRQRRTGLLHPTAQTILDSVQLASQWNYLGLQAAD